MLGSAKILSFLRIAALEEPDFADNFRLRQSSSYGKDVYTYLERILEGFMEPEKSDSEFSLSKELKFR